MVAVGARRCSPVPRWPPGTPSIGASRIPPAADNIPCVPEYPTPSRRRRSRSSRGTPASRPGRTSRAGSPPWRWSCSGWPSLAVRRATWSGSLVRGVLRRTTRALPVAAAPAVRPRAPPARWSPRSTPGLVELDDQRHRPAQRGDRLLGAPGGGRRRGRRAPAARRHPDRPGHPAAARRPVGRDPGDRQRRRAGRFAHVYREARYATRDGRRAAPATRPGRRCAGCAANSTIVTMGAGRGGTDERAGDGDVSGSASIDDLLDLRGGAGGRGTSATRAAGPRRVLRAPCSVTAARGRRAARRSARGRPAGARSAILVAGRARGARAVRRVTAAPRRAAAAHAPARRPAPGTTTARGTGPPGTRCAPRSTAGNGRWTGPRRDPDGSPAVSCPGSPSWPTSGCASGTA